MVRIAESERVGDGLPAREEAWGNWQARVEPRRTVWPAAETAFRLAIRLDPSNAAAHRTLGHALSQSGRPGEAESAMRRTRELDPLEPFSYALSAQVAFQARDYHAAVEHARRAVLTDSEFWIGYVQLGQAYEPTAQDPTLTHRERGETW